MSETHEVQPREEVALFAEYLFAERALAPLTIRTYTQAARALIHPSSWQERRRSRLISTTS